MYCSTVLNSSRNEKRREHFYGFLRHVTKHVLEGGMGAVAGRGGATVLFAHRRKFISGMKNAPSSRPSPPFKMAIYLISCGMTVSRRDFVGEIPVLGLSSIGRRARYGRRRKFRSNLDGSPPLPLRRHPLNQQPPQTSLRFPDVCISIALFRYCVESGSKNSRSLHPPSHQPLHQTSSIYLPPSFVFVNSLC